jgi:hypothetical protein
LRAHFTEEDVAIDIGEAGIEEEEVVALRGHGLAHGGAVGGFLQDMPGLSEACRKGAPDKVFVVND